MEREENDQRELMATTSLTHYAELDESNVANVATDEHTASEVPTTSSKRFGFDSCYASESTSVAEILCLAVTVLSIFAVFSVPIFIHFFVSDS